MSKDVKNTEEIINLSPEKLKRSSFILDRKKAKGTEVPFWMITFTDVMALMLTFFVLLFSMSTPNEEEWSEVVATLNAELGSYVGYQFDEGAIDSINMRRVSLNQALDLSYLKSILQKTLSEENLLKDVSLITQYDSLIISLPENLLFKSGGVVLSDDGEKAIYALAELLNRLDNRIEILGQADPRPVSKNSDYVSNWDLSLTRSAAVAVALSKNGYEKNVRIIGLSSGRYDELPESWAEEDKLNLSRRVDIAVMEDDGSIIRHYNDSLSGGLN